MKFWMEFGAKPLLATSKPAKLPTVVGIPVMRKVPGEIDRPGGNPPAARAAARW